MIKPNNHIPPHDIRADLFLKSKQSHTQLQYKLIALLTGNVYNLTINEGGTRAMIKPSNHIPPHDMQRLTHCWFEIWQSEPDFLRKEYPLVPTNCF